MAKEPKQSVHERVTQRILDELENGCAPWVKPWNRSKASVNVTMPTNLDSGVAYRGINVFLLWSAAISNDWDDWRFVTYKQAQKLGGQVKKGSKAEPVCFFKKMAKDVENDQGETETKSFGFWRSYNVFNIEQVEGLPDQYFEQDAGNTVHDRDFDEFLAMTGARLKHGGNDAFYQSGGDFIQMPHASQFQTMENYKATLLHEMTHWTGHESRCNRDMSGAFGSKKYAFEELIAELGAALLCAELGVVGDIRHAAYIQSWIKLLKDDKHAFISAASRAQHAVDWVRAKALSDGIQQAA